jgi:cardiolipin synthase (CMP-forming)
MVMGGSYAARTCSLVRSVPMEDKVEQLSSHKYLTYPNLFTLVRLCCIPLFLYLLFPRDNVAGAAFLLGALGATDWVDGWLARHFNQVSEFGNWVDGWLARHFNQVSEFGKIFDPTADRLLFIIAIGGILGKGIPPAWVFWLIIIREVVFGGTVAVCTLLFKMERFDVTWLGKTATFLLMFAIPGFMLGATDFPLHQAFLLAAWLLAIPGLALSYYTAFTYIPTIRESLRAGRTRRG